MTDDDATSKPPPWSGEAGSLVDHPAPTTGGPKAGKAWPLLLFLALVVFGGCVAITNMGDDSTDPSAPVVDDLYTVTYLVTGSAPSADLTIATPNGTSQQNKVDVPLRPKGGGRGLKFTMSAGDFVYISAQNNGRGTITCTIELDGVPVATNTSTGEFAIATCKGRI